MARGKNYLLLDSIRGIKKAKGRFISLFLLSALTMMVFLSLRVGLVVVEESYWEEYDRRGGYDLRVQSPISLSGSFLKEIQARWEESSSIGVEFSVSEGSSSVIHLRFPQYEHSSVHESLILFLEEMWAEIGEGYLQELDDIILSLEEEIQDAEEEGEGYLRRLESSLTDLESALSQGWADYLLSQEKEEIRQWIGELETEKETILLEYQRVEEITQSVLSTLRKNLQQKQRDREELSEKGWLIQGKEDDVAVEEFYQQLELWQNVSDYLPMLFFWTFCVIFLFALYRMVAEERSRMGALFAMGYTKGEISVQYIAYGLLPTLLGGLLGGGVALFYGSRWIFQLWERQYPLGEFFYFFPLLLLGRAFLVFFLVPTVAGGVAVLSQSHEAPSRLMRPKPPITGGHIFLEKNYLLWKQLNFNQKVALRNIFRHKKRLVTNVLSIAVVTSLMVTALGVLEAFPQMVLRQYREIYRYSGEISTVENPVKEELLEIQGVLSSYALQNSYISLEKKEITLSYGGEEYPVELYIFDNTTVLQEYITLRMGRWGFYSMPDTGLVITSKLAQMMDLSLGDKVLCQGEGIQFSPQVSAFTEQYVAPRVYLTADYYTQLTGEEVDKNHYFVKIPSYLSDSSWKLNVFQEEIRSLASVTEYIHLVEEEENITIRMLPLLQVFFFFFLASCILASLVLYQLNDNTLSHRRGELATLKVLGLYDRELSAYVYRENIIFTFEGVVLGIFLGQNLYLWLIRRLEPVDLMFFRGVPFDCYLFGAGLTVVFALVVNLLSHWQIKKLPMVEEIKSMES